MARRRAATARFPSFIAQLGASLSCVAVPHEHGLIPRVKRSRCHKSAFDRGLAMGRVGVYNVAGGRRGS